MATTKRESRLGKEKRVNSPSNPSVPAGQRNSTTDKPNYLKSTASSRNDVTKNIIAKKAGPEDSSQKPNLLRRRSFDRPPSAARVQKALLSPAREKPTASTLRSASFSSKPTPSTTTTSTSASKVTVERVAKKPNPNNYNAGKPQSTLLSSSRSMKKTSTKKASTASSAFNKHPNSHDNNEAENNIVESKLGMEETLDHHHQVEEVVKEDQVDDSELPKGEESQHLHEQDDVLGTTELKSPADIISTVVSPEHNDVIMPETKETEDKPEEEFDQTDHADQHDGDKENQISKEETGVGDDDEDQEKIPNEEAKAETEEEEKGEEEATEEVAAATKEVEEEKQGESRQENNEGSQVEAVEGEAEQPKAETANVVAIKSQAQAGHGKKESATPYNNVIKETASKLLEERKNKVRALVGAFETVIDKETSNAK